MKFLALLIAEPGCLLGFAVAVFVVTHLQANRQGLIGPVSGKPSRLRLPIGPAQMQEAFD